jgi:hypothetical protein
MKVGQRTGATAVFGGNNVRWKKGNIYYTKSSKKATHTTRRNQQNVDRRFIGTLKHKHPIQLGTYLPSGLRISLCCLLGQVWPAAAGPATMGKGQICSLI